MNGKTHLAIGVSVGVSMTLYAVVSSNPTYALGMLSAPIGAMLPDIDHNSTKIGRVRKSAVKTIKIVTAIVAIITTLVSVFYGMIGKTEIMTKLLVAVVPITLIIFIATSNAFKQRFPFLAKHRGIMHTLCFPLAGLWCSQSLEGIYLNSILVGLFLGYLSHIFADCLTCMGCPIAFPISKNCYSLLPVVTGSPQEYVVAASLMLAIIAYGFFATDNPAIVTMFLTPVTYLFGKAILDKLNMVRAIRNSKRVKLLILLVSIVLFMCLAFMSASVFKYSVMGLLLGLSKGCIDRLLRKEKASRR